MWHRSFQFGKRTVNPLVLGGRCLLFWRRVACNLGENFAHITARLHVACSVVVLCWELPRGIRDYDCFVFSTCCRDMSLLAVAVDAALLWFVVLCVISAFYFLPCAC